MLITRLISIYQWFSALVKYHLFYNLCFSQNAWLKYIREEDYKWNIS